MSAPEGTRRLLLSPRARQDFIDILRYTRQTWGDAQVASYRGRIDDALRFVARHPEAGHHRADLPLTHRLFMVGAHVIVYRERGDAVAVVRILHQRMSVPRHL